MSAGSRSDCEKRLLTRHFEVAHIFETSVALEQQSTKSLGGDIASSRELRPANSQQRLAIKDFVDDSIHV